MNISNKSSYLPEDSRAYKMAEVAHINRISKERSEIQSQKMKTFFDKMKKISEFPYFSTWNEGK